jgi:lipopolysaccharide transport system permease protein
MTDTGIPYPVFVVTGTLIWQTFAISLMAPLNSVQANKNILVKVNFPREAVIISGLYETIFNVGISISIAFIFLLSSGLIPDWHIILFLPAIVLLILFGTGIGLLLLPIGTLYKDIQYGLPSVLQFLMYLSPVVYAQPDFFGLASVLKYNPVAPLINWARSSMVGQSYIPSLDVLLIITGISILILFAGLILQRISMEILVERMGS